jgi:hypothetical protein
MRTPNSTTGGGGHWKIEKQTILPPAIQCCKISFSPYTYNNVEKNKTKIGQCEIKTLWKAQWHFCGDPENQFTSQTSEVNTTFVPKLWHRAAKRTSPIKRETLAKGERIVAWHRGAL